MSDDGPFTEEQEKRIREIIREEFGTGSVGTTKPITTKEKIERDIRKEVNEVAFDIEREVSKRVGGV